jgi:hypothetical protein
LSAPVKLGAFAVVLATLFGAGALAGEAFGPEPSRTAVASEPHAQQSRAHDEPAERAATHDEATSAPHAKPAASATSADAHGGREHPVRGLGVAENGLRLVVDEAELRRGARERLHFRILDDAGRAVRDFDVTHEKKLHLILARRDLTGFQHLHPEQRSDGTWTTALRLEEAGSYRLFADFAHDGESFTLATDLRVDGSADLRSLPPAKPAAVSDGGYDVRLDAGSARAGKEAQLRFTVTKGGRSVHPEPYLGARGHLVALREGDLAFLHVHPTEHGHGTGKQAAGTHDDAIGFAATFPTEGRYRLFLQFQHEGRVQTVAFTQEVR